MKKRNSLANSKTPEKCCGNCTFFITNNFPCAKGIYTTSKGECTMFNYKKDLLTKELNMSVEKYVDGEKCVDLCCPIKDSREINLQAMLNLVAMSCDKKIEFDVGGRRYLIREVVAKGKVKSETKRKK